MIHARSLAVVFFVATTLLGLLLSLAEVIPMSPGLVREVAASRPFCFGPGGDTYAVSAGGSSLAQ